MKRLYLVGTTADGKRLVLAQRSGAKFGSFVVPITPKMRRVVREHEEGRAAPAKGGKAAATDPGSAEAEPAMTAAEAAASNTFERMTGLSGRKGAATRGGSAAPDAPRGKPAARARPVKPEPEPEREPEPAPRRPPINSKLAPAQIQAMLRQGKSPRSVAKAAGAPLEWVQRLMMPILQERMGIVEELKRATFTKARKGSSTAPVGVAIVDNLRERGVPFPERTAGEGWTASRPDNREWRVRFTFAHRGSNRTAQWEYDPATRTVVPMNPLATQLAWRGHPSEDNGDGGEPRRSSPARRRTARKAAARRTARKPAAKRKGAARKTPARKTPARRTTARKASGKRAPARGRSSSRRS